MKKLFEGIKKVIKIGMMLIAGMTAFIVLTVVLSSPKKLTKEEAKLRNEKIAKRKEIAKKKSEAEKKFEAEELAKTEAMAKAAAKKEAAKKKKAALAEKNKKANEARRWKNLSDDKKLGEIVDKRAQEFENVCMRQKSRLAKKYLIDVPFFGGVERVRLWPIWTGTKNREGLVFYNQTFVGKNRFGHKARWTIKCKFVMRKIKKNGKFILESAKL